MPRRPYGTEEDINLLRMALMEQNANAAPGRVPSGIAHNAYLGSIPRTFEQEREGDIINAADARYLQNRADDRKRESGLEDFRASATARQFETRRGVEEDPGTLAGSPAPEQMRTIRRFSENKTATDPDMAASAMEKATRDPRVIAEKVRTAGELAAVAAKAKAGQPDTTEEDATRDEIVRLATEIRDSGYLNSNVGPLDASGWIPTMRGGSHDFQAKTQRLRDLLSLEARSKLKGSGSISNFETEMLANSQSALRLSTDEGSFKNELNRIIGDQVKRTQRGSAAGGVKRFNPATGKLE